MENNKNKKSVKFQGDMLNFCDFIQVFVFTRNHHLNCLGSLSLLRKRVIKLTDRLDMTIDYYRGSNNKHQQQQQQIFIAVRGICKNHGMIIMCKGKLTSDFDQVCKVKVFVRGGF